MKMNNMMMQELNDTRLDMVNGGGFFSSLVDSIKEVVPGITESASELWEATKYIVTSRDRIY